MANPLKRARNKSADGREKAIEFTRHPDFWFDDGSIVLSVEKTLFRVHRTMLCTHSEVFFDMFGLSQPLGEPMIEECPVVRLPDRACDMEHLLRALYNPFFRPNLMSADQLEGILRLSTKYEMSTCRQEYVSYLTSLYPTTLYGFDAFEHDWRPYVDREPVRPNCLWAVTIAREVNIPQILPCAMYCCTRLPAQEIIRGDGRNRLSQEDQNICWAAQKRLEEMTRSGTFGFLHDFQPSFDCQTKEECGNGSQGNLRSFHCDERVPGRTYAKVGGPLSVEDFSRYKDNVCGKCLIAMEARHKARRREVWSALPDVFGMGSWNDIYY